MNSHEIKEALSHKHTKDYFMTEALCGSAGSQRFDAFAIAKSWTNLKYTGYEIKVSRADFLQDEKWRGYLPYCNEFWWVCPKDMIKAEEIPEGCGLIYVYPETMVMRKIKRAKFRDIEHPVEILLHALMWREFSNPYPFFNDKAEFFKAWLNHREMKHSIGDKVSKAFNEELNKLRNVNSKNELLERELTSFGKLKELLRKEGVRFYQDSQMLEEVEKRLRITVPSDIVEKVQEIKNRSELVLSRLQGGQNA